MQLIRKLVAASLTIATLATTETVLAADTGVTDRTIAIGMSSPFSGPTGAYGVDMRDTIAAYFDHINRAGGIHGRMLKLIAIDDGYETARTVANTKKLIEQQKVFTLLQFYGSSPTTEAMKIFSAAKVPLIGTISGADTLRQPANRYMFNVRASYADETEAIVNQLVSLGITNIAVFYQNDGFGKSGLNGVTSALKRHNLEPVAVASVERNSLDVAGAVTTIAKADPQAVIMVTLYKPTAAFVRQMHTAGHTPQFMTLSPVGADMLVQELDTDARGIGISQVMPYPWDDSIPIVREYQRIMSKANPKTKYSYYGVEAFITAKILVQALQNIGKDLSREKLIAALEAMGSHDVGGYRISYSPESRQGSQYVDLTVVGSGGKVLR